MTVRRAKRLKYLSPKKVAEIYDLRPRTIARQCREGKFKGAVKVGRVWRIPESSLE